jgi:hypothetical protein
MSARTVRARRASNQNQQERKSMRPDSSRFLVLAVLILAATAACARGVDFSPDPTQTHAINVVNALPHAMIVWFDDGTGERLLGTVGAGSQDRFVIAGTDATTISVIGRNEANTQTVRRTVTLTPGRSVDVRLD